MSEGVEKRWEGRSQGPSHTSLSGTRQGFTSGANSLPSRDTCAIPVGCALFHQSAQQPKGICVKESILKIRKVRLRAPQLLRIRAGAGTHNASHTSAHRLTHLHSRSCLSLKVMSLLWAAQP